MIDSLAPVLDAGLSLGLARLWPYWLSAVRFFGLALTVPGLSNAAVPHRLRLALAVLLAVVATPPAAAPVGDWPEPLWLAAGELLIGAALGLGIALILSGLNVAASLLEQSCGLPAAGDSSDAVGEPPGAGQLLAVLGTLVFLTAAPFGSDLFLLRTVLDSLHRIPPGALANITAPISFVHDVALAAIALGLQVAAPLVISVGLFQFVWSMLARRSGGAVWYAPLTPLRLLLGLVVLSLTLTSMGERIGEALHGVASVAGEALTAGTEAESTGFAAGRGTQP